MNFIFLDFNPVNADDCEKIEMDFLHNNVVQRF